MKSVRVSRGHPSLVASNISYVFNEEVFVEEVVITGSLIVDDFEVIAAELGELFRGASREHDMNEPGDFLNDREITPFPDD